MNGLFARIFLVPLTVALGVVQCVAQKPEFVYVAPLSNTRPVKREELLCQEYLREAIIFCLQRNHCAVVHPDRDPALTPLFGFIPRERAWSRRADMDAAVVIERDDVLRVFPQVFSEDQPATAPITVDDSIRDFLPIATKVVARVAAHLPSNGLMPIGTPPSPPETLTNSARLDWSFGRRLERINELLKEVDRGNADAGVYAELAALYALHASYYCRENLELCLRYCGNAQLFAELAAAGGAPWATQLREEIHGLTRRFGAGIPMHGERAPLLPEVAVLLNYENRTLIDATRGASISNLFDFLVHTDNDAQTRGTTDASSRFMSEAVDKYPMDAACIWALGSSSYSGALMARNPSLYFTNQFQEVCQPFIDGETNTFRAEFLERFTELRRSPALTFHKGGAHIKDKLDQLCPDAKDLLPVLEAIEACEELASDEMADTNVCLQATDILPEFRDRLLTMLLLIRDGYTYWGWGKQKSDIVFLLNYYGSDRIRVWDSYESSPEFLPSEIVAAHALAVFLENASNSGFAGPATRVWNRLKPDIKARVVKNDETLTDVELTSSLLIALNDTLHDRYFYDSELFADVEIPAEIKEDLTNGTSNISEERLRVMNRRLLEIVLKPWLVRCDLHGLHMNRLAIDLASRLDTARLQFYKGKFGESAQLLQPCMPAFDSEDWIDYWDLLKFATQRAGHVETTLPWIDRLNNADRERYRSYVLYWCRDTFPGVPESAFDEGRDSAMDYITRSEHAFRKRDFTKMLDIATNYHYPPPSYLIALQQLGRTLTQGRDNDSQWRCFSTCLSSALEDSSDLQSFIPHWVAILNDELGQNPYWLRTRTETHLDDWKTLTEAEQSMDGDHDGKAFEEAYTNLAALTTRLRLLQPSNPSSLLQKAVTDEHQALARWLIAEKLPTTPTAELRALTTIRHCRGVPLGLSSVKMRAPDEALFLIYMLRFGTKADAIADWMMHMVAVRGALSTLDPPEFSGAVSNTTLFAHVLDCAVRLDRPERLEEVSLRSLPRCDCCAAAIRLGLHDYALKCGGNYVRETWDITPLLPYLRDSSHAKEWIMRNAPNREIASQWEEALSASRVQSTEGIILPDLIEIVK